MRADPIHGGRVAAAEDESKVERLGRQRTIGLARHDGVGHVDHPALNFVGHYSGTHFPVTSASVASGPVAPAVEKNAIQIQAGSPDGVVARPGAISASAV